MNRTPEIKLVVFDLAGTTVEDNDDVPRILQGALCKYDIFIPLEEAVKVMGIPKPVAILKLATKYADAMFPPTSDLLSAIHETFQQDMIEFYKKKEGLTEKPGVTETFEALRSLGIKIALDTGFDRPTADVVIDRMGWVDAGLIDFSVTSDEVQKGRPFPDMIFAAMRATGVGSAVQTAKVGDTASDMMEGMQAGCGLVIGVTSGAYSRDELLKQPHTHLVEQLPEILPILSFSVRHENA